MDVVHAAVTAACLPRRAFRARIHGQRAALRRTARPGLRRRGARLGTPRARLATWALICSAGCVPDPVATVRADGLDEAYLRIVAAEDARPEGDPEASAELRTIIEAAGSEHVLLRRSAVRALGRLERPELTGRILPFLSDPAPEVRRSAAQAVAQSVYGTEGSAVVDALLGRLEVEEDPLVLGTIARSLGRLDVAPGPRERNEARIAELAWREGRFAPGPTVLGVLLGLDASLSATPRRAIASDVRDRLLALTRYPARFPQDRLAARIRTLAFGALGHVGGLDRALIEQAIRDDAPQAGATALRHIDAVGPDHRTQTLLLGLELGSPPTRLEALRRLAEQQPSRSSCERLLTMVAPAGAGPSVPLSATLLALDALSRPCPGPLSEVQRQLLADVASALGDDDTQWRRSSHALAALARLAPGNAVDLVAKHAAHADPFVRARSARAAGVLGARTTLRALATDVHPNVRTEAIRHLFDLEGHAVDPLLRAQLAADDPQLLLTAARLLEGTPRGGEAAVDALAAFVRISSARHETLRDARRALLGVVAAGGDPSMAHALEPFVRDYDPLVARDVSATLTEWSGREVVPAPEPLPRAEFPDAAELRRLAGSRVRLHMANGGIIEIELHPYEATTNVARFARLVDEGYFDGLTFHRWEPNFVIQGGSPGANEYRGAALFSRDEVGLLGHWRGTVGVSTRGRDTGDAQIFVNLMDNVRLDHAYTIIGTVVDGMDTVDTVLEGTVIERAEVIG